MLRSAIPIGRIFGIPIRLHYSWFIIFGLITWALAGIYFPDTYPSWSLGLMIGAGLVTSFLFFGSVLLHELMHSLVAIRQGMGIESITLFILGGVSQIKGEPESAPDEFRMAFAGPFTSLVLGGIFFGIYFGIRDIAGTPAEFGTAVAFYLGLVNVALGIFNLIPGFPLDGGRVFRSIVWWRGKDLINATRIASNVGRGFGYLFIFAGIWLLFTGFFFDGVWLAIIGWFLSSAAAGSYRQLLLQESLKGHSAREIMSTDCTLVSAGDTLEQLVNENILTSGRRCFPVTSGKKVEGLITLADVRSIPRDRWTDEKVKQAMTPLDKLRWVKPDEDLSKILKMMSQGDINQVPVMEDGNIIGMIARDNLINFVNTRAEISR